MVIEGALRQLWFAAVGTRVLESISSISVGSGTSFTEELASGTLAQAVVKINPAATEPAISARKVLFIPQFYLPNL